MNMIEEIVHAMDDLGYPREKRITMQFLSQPDIMDHGRATIVYGDKEIGVYDFKKHTFVD